MLKRESTWGWGGSGDIHYLHTHLLFIEDFELYFQGCSLSTLKAGSVICLLSPKSLQESRTQILTSSQVLCLGPVVPKGLLSARYHAGHWGWRPKSTKEFTLQELNVKITGALPFYICWTGALRSVYHLIQPSPTSPLLFLLTSACVNFAENLSRNSK